MLQGKLFSVWTLDQGRSAGDEVKTFLQGFDEVDKGSYAKALLARIRHLADNVPAKLPNEIRDCWDEDGERFCEIKKGAWRISYFLLGNGRRILLATVFRKHGMKATSEYRRALGLVAEFRQHELWERSEL